LSRIKQNNKEKLTKDDNNIYSNNYIGKVKSLEIEHEITPKNLFKPTSDKIDSSEEKYEFKGAKRKNQKKRLRRLQKARVQMGCKVDKYVQRITGNRWS
jgi:hypothetical protein